MNNPRLLHNIRKWIEMKRHNRYANLFRLIDEYVVRSIMEIGTWNGKHAERMIRTAQRHYPKSDVKYYGFDLFETMTPDVCRREVGKKPPDMDYVDAMLQFTGARITLLMGDTNETLKIAVKTLPKMDFIFIDGGRSLETIKNDWEYAKKLMHKKTVVVFDDYFVNHEPEVHGIGCQRLIGSLDWKKYNVNYLEPVCHFKEPWGTLNVRMVKVMLR